SFDALYAVPYGRGDGRLLPNPARMEFFAKLGADPEHPAFVFGFAGFCAAFWVAWAFVFRGGYGFWRGGVAPPRPDRRKAPRWQSACRAFLGGAPVTGLFCLANGVALLCPGLPGLYFGIWGLGVALLFVYVGLALWSPRQALHDRLAGTYLVPGNFS